jgi:hypothetical protein
VRWTKSLTQWWSIVPIASDVDKRRETVIDRLSA